MRITSLTSLRVEHVEVVLWVVYQYEAMPRSFARLETFRSKVAMASYRLAVARAAIDASAKPGRRFGQSSKMRFHGQSSVTCTPGKERRSRIIEASRSPMTP